MLYDSTILGVMTPYRQQAVSYNTGHFSFGTSCIHRMKGMGDDAYDGAGFEEDLSPACTEAYFMVSSSSFLEC
jgi:hypothetical protein